MSDGRISTSAPITPIRRLSGGSAPLGVINTAVTRGRMELHSRGGGGASPQGPIPPKKKKSNKKIPEEEFDWVEFPSPLTARRARAVYFCFVNLGLRLQTRGDRGNGFALFFFSFLPFFFFFFPLTYLFKPKLEHAKKKNANLNPGPPGGRWCILRSDCLSLNPSLVALCFSV